MIVTFVFPAVLRLDDITPVSEKGSKTSKEYFGPVSILPNVSKIFERILFQQVFSYFGNFFSMFECDFRLRNIEVRIKSEINEVNLTWLYLKTFDREILHRSKTIEDF